MLDLGLVLCDVQRFQELFDDEQLRDIASSERQQDQLDSIYSKLNELLRQSSKPEATKEALIEFLTSARFVPKEISECFLPLSLTARGVPRNVSW